jgi:hypothetical protein
MAAVLLAYRGAVFATRNVAYARGQIVEPAAVLRIAHRTTEPVRRGSDASPKFLLENYRNFRASSKVAACLAPAPSWRPS